MPAQTTTERLAHKSAGAETPQAKRARERMHQVQCETQVDAAIAASKWLHALDDSHTLR